MAKALNFKTIKKTYLPVTFDDEKGTTIFVGTPTKAVLNDLVLLQAEVESFGDESVDPAALDELFTACAAIMSRNKTGHKITKAFLEKVFDFEDIVIFLHAYTEFVGEVIDRKN